MKDVRITAVRQTVYTDLIDQFEKTLDNPCCVTVGQEWVSVGAQCPEGFCPSAWETLRPFVESLSQGKDDFYGDWMQFPLSAMISCNDGFRPVSFFLKAL